MCPVWNFLCICRSWWIPVFVLVKPVLMYTLVRKKLVFYALSGTRTHVSLVASQVCYPLHHQDSLCWQHSKLTRYIWIAVRFLPGAQLFSSFVLVKYPTQRAGPLIIFGKSSINHKNYHLFLFISKFFYDYQFLLATDIKLFTCFNEMNSYWFMD